MGLSHHTATVDVRERLAVPEAEWQIAAERLCECAAISEAAVLSTCNRFEVYIVADHPFKAIQEVVAHLSSRSGLSVTELRKHLFMLTEDEASWHLMRVSAGLDSLVIGEGQILSQVKKCYELASDADGHAGKILQRLLNNAVSAGKRVRSETGIAKGAVSISSAAVELAEMKAVPDLDLPLKDAKVCILGAGKMSRLLVQHLLSRGVADITIVNRSIGRAEELAKMFPDASLHIKLLDSMIESVATSDIIFTSTAASAPILTKDMLTPALDPLRRSIVIDISVPRNVSDDVAEIDNMFSYNVDDLKAVVAKNQARRRRLMLEAEDLLREELATFNNWHNSLGCIPAISKLQQRAESIRQDEMDRVKGKLSDLSASELKAVEQLSKGIINKMLHSPMVHLRGLADLEERTQTLKNIEALFKL
ncbi:glutamyl-tRNA reductase [Chondrus crispus]|uniref:Glutamyl-tRNA reductase n=1 Tax=Chondrus crispus TaxID=2769 RepID=R7QP86_CHOCR|nr:glutamyl-tRNA reductase [Chondrus crispus]CDF39578.1 glutamyl-tRNA reductase [Chondrus crispus]|eukprot:XP_005709872.1 glutamyl-tRNA reductase [Chondrus crispus]